MRCLGLQLLLIVHRILVFGTKKIIFVLYYCAKLSAFSDSHILFLGYFCCCKHFYPKLATFFMTFFIKK
jgi:hypothetical protein